jgi:hypothetical protein
LQQEPPVPALAQLAPPEQQQELVLQRVRRAPVLVLKLASLRGFQRQKPVPQPHYLQRRVLALNRRRQQRR